MYKLYPYFTNDGSVGLYSPSIDDIYHSSYGAATEAYEKFILPCDFKNYFRMNNEIKILDICFGIGYNTKLFLKNFYENIYNETIHTNNIINNDTIDTNNRRYKILIDAVDKDKILTNLSPFFIKGKTSIKKQKMIFNNERIKRILDYKKNDLSENILIDEFINIILLNKIINNIDNSITKILADRKYNQFFDHNIIAYFKHVKNTESVKHPINALNSFLHNIYYKYISRSHKMALRALKNVDFNFRVHNEDIREFIIRENFKYNYMFLDGFTPEKCPCIWTYDFFKALYERLEDNGIIITYTTSARVRNAMIHAGFKIFKIYSESQKKFSGTLAIKKYSPLSGESKSSISEWVHHLSQYDLNLIKTKAGIFYRDENLNLDNESIIKQHEIDVKNSNLISTSQFKKHNML